MLEAVKITEETYHLYLQMPAPQHLDLQYVIDSYLVKGYAVDGWRWVDESLFNTVFKFVDQENPTAFAEVVVNSL